MSLLKTPDKTDSLLVGSLAQVPSRSQQAEEVRRFAARLENKKDDPIMFHASVSSHPNTVLRRTGLIHQTGKWLFEDVYYDAGERVWKDKKTGTVQIGCQEVYCRNRRDVTNKAVIRVVGDLDLKGVKKVLEKRKSKRNPAIVHEFYTFDEFLANVQTKNEANDDTSVPILELENELSSASNNRRNSTLLSLQSSRGAQVYQASQWTDLTETGDNEERSQASTTRSIEHFMSQAIPKVAKKLDALLVCSDTGDLARLLGQGAYSLKTDDYQLKLIGIHSRETPKEKLNRRFALHLMLTGPHTQHHLSSQIEPPPATRTEVTNFTQRLLRDLSLGFHKNTAMAEQNTSVDPKARPPPNRDPVPVVLILVGGSDEEAIKRSAMQSVRNRWPLILIAGTGGYTDKLVGLIHKVRRLAPDAGLDEFRTCLGVVDAKTAEIVIQSKKGQLYVVYPEQSSEELQRTIASVLRGNETLRLAWKKYAEYASNGIEHQIAFKMYQVAILMTGILATGLSILQTFLQLLFPQETAEATLTSTKIITIIYTFLSWVVIALPITISLLQAIANKLNSGAKWVSLRGASERMLREIYYFRTQTEDYSPARLNERVQEATENDTEVLKSREELLHSRMDEFTRELAESEISTESLVPWHGPVPPNSIEETGDDGYSDLTPDDYVRLRLNPKIECYRDDASQLTKIISTLNTINYGLGAGGTLLAALAVQDSLLQYNLQAWVALTTAIVNALTRYQDYSRHVWLQKKYLKILQKLGNIEMWWTSLDSGADNSINRNKLIQDTETIVTDEVDEWEKQLKNAMEKMKKAQEAEKAERAQIIRDLNEGREHEKMKKMRELGLDKLSPDMLKEALSNPRGAMAGELKGVISKITTTVAESEEGKAMLTAAKTKLASTEKGKQALELAGKAEQAIETVQAGVEKALEVAAQFDGVLPPVLNKFISDKETRDNFLSDLMSGNVDPMGLTMVDFEGMVKKIGTTVSSKLTEASPQQLLTIAKQMGMEEMKDQFVSQLGALNIGLGDIIPDKNLMEDLISEFKSLSALPWKEMDMDQMLGIIKNEEIKSKLAKLPEASLRGLIKRGEKILLEPTPLVSMVQYVSQELVGMEVESIFEDPTVRIEMVKGIEELQNLQFRFDLLPKENLLVYFPPQLAGKVEKKSHLAIVMLLDKLFKSSLGRLAFNSYLCTNDWKMPHPTLDSIFSKSEQNTERFANAVQKISQATVNRQSKAGLIKRLGVCVIFTKDLSVKLNAVPVNYLKGLTSGFLGFFANRHSAKVFDALADEKTDFDMRSNFDYEDQEKLVSAIRNYRGKDVSSLPKADILRFLNPCNTKNKLLHMPEEVLQDIFGRMMHLTKNTFNVRVFRKAANVCRPDFPSDHMHTIDSWDEELVDRVVVASLYDLRESAHSAECQGKTATGQAKMSTEYIVKATPDSWVKSELMKLDTKDICMLIKAINRVYGERAESHIFQATSRYISNQKLLDNFTSAFKTPSHRRSFIKYLTGWCDKDPKDWMAELDQIYQETGESLPDADFEEEMNLVMQPSVSKLRSIKKPFRENEMEVNRVAVGVLQELILNSGYALFLKACVETLSYDLRGLLIDFGNRQLAVLLIERIYAKRMLNIEKIHLDTGSHESATSEAGEELQVINKFRVVSSRKKILDACDAQMCPQFNRVIRDFTTMTEPQLQMFFGKIITYIRATSVGRFFKYRNRRLRREEPEKDIDSMMEMEAIFTIRKKLERTPSIVEDLENFDANAFVSKLDVDKKAVLAKYLPRDDLVALIARFSEEQCEKFFWNMQSCCGHMSKTSNETFNFTRKRPEQLARYRIEDEGDSDDDDTDDDELEDYTDEDDDDNDED